MTEVTEKGQSSGLAMFANLVPCYWKHISYEFYNALTYFMNKEIKRETDNSEPTSRMTFI